MRRTILLVLTCAAVAVTAGCSDGPPSRHEVVQQTCQRLRLLAEPYSVRAPEPPFGLLRPTDPAREWRQDGEAMEQAATRLEGLDLRVDLAGRWAALGRYLIATSRHPETYDTAAVEAELYPADGGCSDAVEETV